MTYAMFLVVFVILPILPLAWAMRSYVKRQHGQLIALLALVALVYTTPWDNYLVANRIWTYDPALVAGVTLGWVPIEEYSFFVLLPILTGLWLLALTRGSAPLPMSAPERPYLRRRSTFGVAVIWLIALAVLLSGWQPGTYLSITLVWALIPVSIQLAFGADILWHYRRRVLLALASATLYLSAADAVAIGAGTWTINPQFSLPILIGGVLPLEEAVFFLLTNTLVVFGLTLALAPESRRRLAALRERLFVLTDGTNHPREDAQA